MPALDVARPRYLNTNCQQINNNADKLTKIIKINN